MVTIVFLFAAALFFFGEGILSLVQFADIVAAAPNFFWAILLAWWAVSLVQQRRRLRSLWPRELGPWKG
jgi:hypothetical protein